MKQGGKTPIYSGAALTISALFGIAGAEYTVLPLRWDYAIRFRLVELKNMDPKKIGVLAILAASLMWAFEPVFAKLAYADADFLQTFAVRAVVAMLAGLFYSFCTGARPLRITRAQLSKILYIALVATIFADLLYFFALMNVPVLNAVLIAHMQPIFIVLIGFFVLREDRLTKFDYLGILTMIVAAILVTAKTPQNLAKVKLGTVGDIYILLATVAWATTAIVTRKYLRQLNAGVLASYRFSIASVVLLVYLLATGSRVLSNTYQILVGLVVGAGTILYYEGLKRIKAAQVSALELSTPFFAALLGFLALGEMVTITQVIGIVLLVVGASFLSRKEEACS